jgi:hypothetical protein
MQQFQVQPLWDNQILHFKRLDLMQIEPFILLEIMNFSPIIYYFLSQDFHDCFFFVIIIPNLLGCTPLRNSLHAIRCVYLSLPKNNRDKECHWRQHNFYHFI